MASWSLGEQDIKKWIDLQIEQEGLYRSTENLKEGKYKDEVMKRISDIDNEIYQYKRRATPQQENQVLGAKIDRSHAQIFNYEENTPPKPYWTPDLEGMGCGEIVWKGLEYDNKYYVRGIPDHIQAPEIWKTIRPRITFPNPFPLKTRIPWSQWSKTLKENQFFQQFGKWIDSNVDTKIRSVTNPFWTKKFHTRPIETDNDERVNMSMTIIYSEEWRTWVLGLPAKNYLFYKFAESNLFIASPFQGHDWMAQQQYLTPSGRRGCKFLLTNPQGVKEWKIYDLIDPGIHLWNKEEWERKLREHRRLENLHTEEINKRWEGQQILWERKEQEWQNSLANRRGIKRRIYTDEEKREYAQYMREQQDKIRIQAEKDKLIRHVSARLLQWTLTQEQIPDHDRIDKIMWFTKDVKDWKRAREYLRDYFPDIPKKAKQIVENATAREIEIIHEQIKEDDERQETITGGYDYETNIPKNSIEKQKTIMNALYGGIPPTQGRNGTTTLYIAAPNTNYKMEKEMEDKEEAKRRRLQEIEEWERTKHTFKRHEEEQEQYQKKLKEAVAHNLLYKKKK